MDRNSWPPPTGATLADGKARGRAWLLIVAVPESFEGERLDFVGQPYKSGRAARLRIRAWRHGRRGRRGGAGPGAVDGPHRERVGGAVGQAVHGHRAGREGDG